MAKPESKYLLFLFSFIGTTLFVFGFFLGALLTFERVDEAKRPSFSVASTPSASHNSSSSEIAIPEFVDREDVDFTLLWDVWKSLKERYYKQPVDDSTLFYGALHGVVGSVGDPYTTFFDPKEAEAFNQELEGKFEGIGAELGMKQGGLTVIAPLPDSPAERAGIRPGDKIFAIDKVDTITMTLDNAVARIRGSKGTSVLLTVLHKGDNETAELTIFREEIVINTVSVKMVGKTSQIAHIRVYSFSENTVRDFKKEVAALIKKKSKAMILDLRSNPGGYLGASVEIASYWIQDGTIVQEKFSDGSNRPYNAVGSAALKDTPTIVLVNDGSASASEIVAGALQDYGKATVVGTTTFGKGNVQDYTEFRDGSAIKITVAEWLTPKGRSISGDSFCINIKQSSEETSCQQGGIIPDVVVDMTREDYEQDLDPQLDRAIQLLDV